MNEEEKYFFSDFKTIRESQNITIEDVVKKTRIQAQYIHYYVDNYKPYDKAGSYGIQDWSSIFVKKIEGCFYNVVGFPLPKFYKLFTQIKSQL